MPSRVLTFTNADWFRRTVGQLGVALKRLPSHRRGLEPIPDPTPTPVACNRSQRGTRRPASAGQGGRLSRQNDSPSPEGNP